MVRRLLPVLLTVGLTACVGAPAALGLSSAAGSPAGTQRTAGWAGTASSPPTASISSPATGGSYTLHETVATRFSCTAPAGATLSSCTDSNAQTGGSGTLDTGKPGTRTYTVTATDSDGQTGTASITYTVIGPPSAKITAPASGQTFEPKQAVSTNFTCTEAANGPGIATCIDSNGSGSPGRLDTSVSGAHVYSVTATSQDGLSTTTKLAYRVIGHPSAKIALPTPREVVDLGTQFATSFTCAPALGGPPITSCVDAAGHASPGMLDTARAGTHHYAVTATASDGQTFTTSVRYSVAAPPKVKISKPARDARYLLGQIVLAAYACKEGSDGPGLASCTGPVSAGAPLDTATAGPHTFIVTAVSQDGQRTDLAVQYTVMLPDNRFTVSHLKLGRHGVLSLWVRVPSAGSLSFRETVRRHRNSRHTMVFSATRRRAWGPGILEVTIHPNRRGRRFARHLDRRLIVKLYVGYTPVNGTVNQLTIFVRGPRRDRAASG